MRRHKDFSPINEYIKARAQMRDSNAIFLILSFENQAKSPHSPLVDTNWPHDEKDNL
jgi:hypothetical protein